VRRFYDRSGAWRLPANTRPIPPRRLQFVAFLEVHPKFRRHAEESCQAQAQISVESPPFFYDSNHPVLRNLDFLSQHLRCHPERDEEFLTKHLAGVKRLKTGFPVNHRGRDHSAHLAFHVRVGSVILDYRFPEAARRTSCPLGAGDSRMKPDLMLRNGQAQGRSTRGTQVLQTIP